jgi:hypothetical protein
MYQPGTGQSVRPGETVTFTINNSDAACFTNWDLTGRCRLFEVTPKVDGELEVGVTRSTPMRLDFLDLFIVPTIGELVIAFEGSDREEAALPVVSGRSYGIFVMSYPPLPQEFTLTLALR